MQDMRIKSGPNKIQRHIFCLVQLMNVIFFICFVKFWFRPPVSLNCSKGQEAAFLFQLKIWLMYSSRTCWNYLHLIIRINFPNKLYSQFILYFIDSILVICKRISPFNMSLVMRKPAFCICENKNADQLRSNCAAGQKCHTHFNPTTSRKHLRT